MSGLDLAGLFKVGVDILTTTVNRVTGKILAQVGSVTEQTTDGDNIEWWQHVGWASRPSKPDAGSKAAQGLLVSCGDHDVCIASQDVRCLDQYGNLDFGEFCAYAAGEDGLAQGRIIGKKDGSVAIFTTDDNTKAGRSVYFRVSPDGFLFVAPFGTLRFDETGFHLLHASGASFDLGAIGGLPAPLDVIGSYIKMQAGTIQGSGSAQSFGSGTPSPLALQVPTAAAIAGLQAQITALQAAIAIFAAPSNPGIATADPLLVGAGLLAAATTGAAVGIAATTAATALLPATTSST